MDHIPKGKIMSNRKRALVISLIVLFACAVMAIVDGIIQPPYIMKSAIKLVCFVAVPIIYMICSRDDRFRKCLKPSKKRIILAFAIGICVYGVIVGGYFLLRGVIDFSGITNSLINGEGVTRENFVYVALYISFVNSFCEELIFRGLAFGALGGAVSRRIAYPFSALTFAVYHVAIMNGWFSPFIFVLMIVGLAVGGMIFDRIDDGVDSIYPSWIIHLFANLGINTVGLVLFGII